VTTNFNDLNKNTTVLDAQPHPTGYVTKDGMYAAVPYGKQYIIIHNGQQVQLCRSLDSAKKNIAKLKKNEKRRKTSV
jgi:ABC-type uncharacterized transport system ATPase component